MPAGSQGGNQEQDQNDQREHEDPPLLVFDMMSAKTDGLGFSASFGAFVHAASADTEALVSNQLVGMDKSAARCTGLTLRGTGFLVFASAVLAPVSAAVVIAGMSGEILPTLTADLLPDRGRR